MSMAPSSLSIRSAAPSVRQMIIDQLMDDSPPKRAASIEAVSTTYVYILGIRLNS